MGEAFDKAGIISEETKIFTRKRNCTYSKQDLFKKGLYYNMPARPFS